MQKKILLFLFGLLTLSEIKAQDPQFSQFYAAPLYLNPAFAGSTQATRAVVNYRNQWPNLDANFVTYAGSFDHYFRKFNSGVGVVGYYDKEGNTGFGSYSIAGQYAYQLNISKSLTFRPGLQAAFSNRNLNPSNLRFPDQFTDEGFQGNPTGENIATASASYFDVSAGGVLYSNNFWIGLATHHMNKPNLHLLGASSRVDIKTSIHAGYKIPLTINEFPRRYRSGQRIKRGIEDGERDVSLTPVINYKHQGPFDQLDAGLYFNYSPMLFGFWYRGIPIKNFDAGGINNDALIFLIGIKYMDLHIGYSYDLTISKLNPSTGGAHEISLIYDFYLGYRNQKKKTPPKNVRRMPCPKL